MDGVIEDYVFFKHGIFCRSVVGKRGNKVGKHKISVGGCKSAGSVMHEIMHTLGTKTNSFF